MLFLDFLSSIGIHVLYLNPYQNVSFGRIDDDTTTYQETTWLPVNEEICNFEPVIQVSVQRQIPNIPAKPQTPQPSHQNNTQELSYEQLALLSISVVMIEVLDEKRNVLGMGSGVVIHSDGYILTNFHVVAGGAYFKVTFEDNVYSEEVTDLIKYHQNYDLAVLRINADCKSIPLRINKEIVRGEKIVAISSPLGLFNTISDGIISAKRHFDDHGMLQFTAPTSPGSSGGAILDLYGNLIGVVQSGYKGQNLNLAVDNKTIQLFCSNFIENIV